MGLALAEQVNVSVEFTGTWLPSVTFSVIEVGLSEKNTAEFATLYLLLLKISDKSHARNECRECPENFIAEQ